MKRFQFRLAPVLRLRRHELEKNRLLLAEVEGEMATRVAARTRCEAALVQATTRLEEESREGMDGGRLALSAQGLMLGQMHLFHAQRAVVELQPGLDEARLRVAAAHARVKSLETLEEKQSERHRREGLAEDQAILEELAVQRLGHLRRVGAESLAARDSETPK